MFGATCTAAPILGRGFGYLSYARSLDDMVVLTFDSFKGRRYARTFPRGALRDEATVVRVEALLAAGLRG